MATIECISANPAVSGIGVRVAVYAQTFLSFAPAFLFTYDGRLDLQEERSLLGIYIPLLITSMALLITTSIQQLTIGLGNHHILLVLNLMWMMNASALVVCVVPTLEWLGRSEVPPFFRLTVDQKSERPPPLRSNRLSHLVWRPKRTRQLLGVVFISIHLTGMGVLGIWHWAVLRIPGLSRSLPPSECFEKINTTYLFIHFPITSQTIRILSLFFYSSMVVPIVNIEIAVMLVYGTSSLIMLPIRRAVHRLFPSRTGMYAMLANDGRVSHWLDPRLKCIVAIIFPLIIAVHTVIDTELMIVKNTPLIGLGESQWSFGQVLALLLVILPLIQALTIFTQGTSVGKRFWRWATNRHPSPRRNRRNFHWLIRRVLAPSGPWSNLHPEIAAELKTARIAVDDLGNELVTLTHIQSHACRLSLPCVAASTIFAIKSLLFLADQTLKITNETFTLHPPLIRPTIRRPHTRPNSSVFEEEELARYPYQGDTNNVEPPQESEEQKRRKTEEKITHALKQLKHSLTEARDKISIAQSVRFPDIGDVSRYNAVASHLKHLLIILDTTLTTTDNLEMAGACFLRAERTVEPYHECHFDYEDAMKQMSRNLAHGLRDVVEEESMDYGKNRIDVGKSMQLEVLCVSRQASDSTVGSSMTGVSVGSTVVDSVCTKSPISE